MRPLFAVVLASGLMFGFAAPAKAQVGVSVGTPYGGVGVNVGPRYRPFYPGYGYAYPGYGYSSAYSPYSGYSPYYGYPGYSAYNSGYYGVAPVVTPYYAPSYYGVYGYPSYGFGYRYRGFGYPAY